MIEVGQLRKKYHDVSALNGFDFKAPDGEITGLLGPNGAGKTTALRSLCGMIQPDDGWMRIDGIDPVTEPLAARRRLGVVPDRAGHYPRLTVREHLDYFGALHGLTSDERIAAIEKTVESLDLKSIIDRRTAGFSQGQRAKVGLAIAITHRPGNVILDEPSVGLDVMSTRALREVMLKLREEGRCVLFSSHIMQEVAALCDRVVVLVAGQTVASGSPQEICELTGENVLEEAFVKLTGEKGISA